MNARYGYCITRNGKVHANDSGRPICGAKAKRWRKVHQNKVTCKRCLKSAAGYASGVLQFRQETEYTNAVVRK